MFAKSKIKSIFVQIIYNMKIEINISDVEYSSKHKRLGIRIQDGGIVKSCDQVYEVDRAIAPLQDIFVSDILDLLKGEISNYLEKNI